MKNILFLLTIVAFTLFTCGEKAASDAAAPVAAPADQAASEHPSSEHPAAQPEAEATSKPAGHPWGSAKVGDWAQYKMESAGVSMEMKYTVTEVTAEAVTYTTATTVMGATTETSLSIPLVVAETPAVEGTVTAPEVTTSEETLEIAGQSLNCTKSTVNSDAGPVESWTSAQVRAGGLVKSSAAGAVTELVAFGNVD
jgi:hypothetical protein